MWSIYVLKLGADRDAAAAQALAEADSVDSVALLVATGQEDRAARLLSSWVDLSGALAIGQVKHAREREREREREQVKYDGGFKKISRAV